MALDTPSGIGDWGRNLLIQAFQKSRIITLVSQDSGTVEVEHYSIAFFIS